MSGRESAATLRGLKLIESGMSLSEAAKSAGVALSTLTRARQRAGLPPLPAGRRPRNSSKLPVQLALTLPKQK